MPAVKRFAIVVIANNAPVEAGGVRERRRRLHSLATDTGGTENGSRAIVVAKRHRKARDAAKEAAQTDAAQKLASVVEALARHRQLATSSEMGPYPKPTEFVRRPLIEEVLKRCPILGC